MTFFVLIPLYWLTSIMLYAASPKQQIKPMNSKQTNQALIPASIAWASFIVVNMASFIWLAFYGWSMVVVGINLLLLNMLIVPASIIFLAHQPRWLIHGTTAVMSISLIAQLITSGA